MAQLEQKMDELFKEFENILEKEGDGEKMKEFLEKNFLKLPKNIQNRIIFVLFAKSLEKISEKKEYSKDAVEAIEIVNKIDDLEKKIKDKIKILDIKQSIQEK